METDNPKEALLSQQPLTTEEPSNVMIPSEFEDDEKGKMNTLEVGCDSTVFHSSASIS